MVYVNKNFSRGKIKKITPEKGDQFYRCNFSQLKVTEIFKGIKNLDFEACNLMNCILPAGTKPPKDCLIVRKSMCSHIHPDVRPLCPVNCQHVIDTYTIKIDNKQANKSYKYEDKVI